MKTYFLCKAKYQKQDDQGRLKVVSEPYLVDAISFTEAETRMYEELSNLIQGEFFITNIGKSKIIDVFRYDDSDLWHRCKITYMLEEEGGKEKKITQLFLITAHDVKQAYERMYESLSNMLVSFKVPEIVETPIIEVFEHISDEEREPPVPEGFTPLNELQGNIPPPQEEAPEA